MAQPICEAHRSASPALFFDSSEPIRFVTFEAIAAAASTAVTMGRPTHPLPEFRRSQG
jgi:hypothetical protein